MVEAKLLRKKLKNGLIVDKWDLVTIIEKQQAEIEALKADLQTTITGDGMEPPTTLNHEVIFDGEKYTTKLVEPKVKELTDEEIKQLQRECITDAYAQAHFHGDKYINSQQAILNFARAILRKAQEK